MSTVYRPEVDGLRAVAVMSVVVYHLNLTVGSFKIAPGGFLGVDVFFVISGYLITLIISRELKSTGRFSFAGFYERRARRLLPALFAVTAVSFPLAWWVMVPSEMAAFSKSVLASLLFVSNIFFWDSFQEYGAPSSHLLPFLHTWSLAVEEQFYLLFPIAFCVSSRFRTRFRHWPVVLVMAAFAGACLLSQVDAKFSFYWLPSRIWELLAGSALALAAPYEAKDTEELKGRRDWRLALPGLGLVLIGLSVLFLELSHWHPGVATLPTIIGTALIIRYAGGRDLVSALLKSRPFVFIGLISYSLYLWHYPILAFARLYLIDVSDWQSVGLMAIILPVSIASWRWIERPFRDSRKVPVKPLAVSILSAAAALGLVAAVPVAAFNTGHAPWLTRLAGVDVGRQLDNAVLLEKTWGGLNDRAAALGLDKLHHNRVSEFEAERLWFSDDPASAKILIVGDSHSKDIYNALDLNQHLLSKVELARYAYPNTVPTEGLDRLARSPNFKAADRVFISMLLHEGSFDTLPDLIRMAQAAGKDVVLMSRSPSVEPIGYQPVGDYYLRTSSDPDPAQVGRVAYSRRPSNVAKVNSRLQMFASDLGVPFVPKDQFIYDHEAKTCDVLLPNGRKAFFDKNHYTLDGAREFGARMIRRYGPLLDVPLDAPVGP